MVRASKIARLQWCAVFAALALSGGCTESPRSCELDSSALVMLATVSDTDAGVEIEIEFETASGTNEPGTSLALCSGADVLTVNGVETSEQFALGHLSYVVEFDDRAEAFDIVLTRKDKTDVTTTITMPPSFELLTPAAGSEQSRAAELEITWSPGWPDHLIEIAVEDEIGSTCIEGLGFFSDPLDDTGSFSLAGGTLVSGEGGGRCEVTVSLTRVLEAPYPDTLAPGGSLTAVVNRRLTFDSID